MMKWFARILIILAILAGLLAGTIYYFLQSETAFKWTLAQIQSIAKQHDINIQVIKPRGNLSHFETPLIFVHSKQFKLYINNANITWDPLSLLAWKLHINNITATSIKLDLYAKHDTASSKHRLLLPYIMLDQFQIRDFGITFPNKKTLYGKLTATQQHDATLFKNIALRYGNFKLKLDKPTVITHTDNTNQFKNLCLSDNDQNKVCFTGTWKDNQDWHIALSPNIHNLYILDALFTDITQTKGQITGTLTGTMMPKLNTPTFAGMLKLQNGSTLIPIIGMHPTNLSAVLKPNDGNLELVGSGNAGKGKMAILGHLNLNVNSPKLSISIIGANLAAINLDAAEATVTPTLTYTLQNNIETIVGNAFIPSATINGDKIHNKASAMDDVEFVSPTGKLLPKPGHQFKTDITVTLGKNVNFKGFGIKTKLKGTLLIHSTPGNPILGDGNWTLYDGNYQTHGKTFTLKKSQLIFNNTPLDNPTLNVYAEYNLPPGIGSTAGAQNIVLGVNVNGTIKHPKINFFSTPAMSRSDILSYIILGVPLNHANASQQAEISQAALSYALNGGNISVLSSLKKKLGISSIGVGSIDSSVPSQLASSSTTSSNQNNTAIFVGKEITKRLFVSYGVGLFNQAQEFRTRFIINQYFQLRTTSSSMSNGADLLFTINK